MSSVKISWKDFIKTGKKEKPVQVKYKKCYKFMLYSNFYKHLPRSLVNNVKSGYLEDIIYSRLLKLRNRANQPAKNPKCLTLCLPLTWIR